MYHERKPRDRRFQVGIALSVLAVLNAIWAVETRLGHGPEDVPQAALESPLLALVVYPPYTSMAIAALLGLMALGFFFLSGHFDEPQVVTLTEHEDEY